MRGKRGGRIGAGPSAEAGSGTCRTWQVAVSCLGGVRGCKADRERTLMRRKWWWGMEKESGETGSGVRGNDVVGGVGGMRDGKTWDRESGAEHAVGKGDRGWWQGDDSRVKAASASRRDGLHSGGREGSGEARW